MRVLAILLTLSISVPAASAGPAPAAAPAPAVERPDPLKVGSCRRATRHHAGKGAIHRGGPTVPRKLDELPPATAFMAVYRTINGCEVPMTVVEYRTGRRP